VTSLDKIVIRALLQGNVEFDEATPNRFAKIGQARFYRPVVGDCRWGLLFGHTPQDYGISLGWFAHTAMMIAIPKQPPEDT
jgi:hypothetical protein